MLKFDPPENVELKTISFGDSTSLKVGQKVILAKYSGTEVKLDREEYTIVRQSDILAVVE